MLRRTRTLSLLALACSLLLGSTAFARCQKFTIGPSKGQVIAGSVVGGAILTTAIALPIIVIHNKHTIQGCVFQGSNGLEVQNGQPASFRNYALTGNTAEIKIGDRVKLHGAKLKHGNGASGAQTFTVDTISKDYGPCTVPLALRGDPKPADTPKV